MSTKFSIGDKIKVCTSGTMKKYNGSIGVVAGRATCFNVVVIGDMHNIWFTDDELIDYNIWVQLEEKLKTVCGD